ncbi:hypothetical protein NA57DRAFT_25722, partial [Rhizodiscina lignyota]
SRFVPAGTLEEPVNRDEEWAKAQQDIEANRKQKEEEGKQEGGKSLYEVLQANKAAKQDAFEEKIRFQNQFRSLDEDDVDFLDSVLESTRAKEAAVRKETSEQLEEFKRKQEEADKANATQADSGSPELEQEHWTVHPRKRKKSHVKENPLGLKLRKTSS